MGKTMGVSPITDTIYYGTVKDNKWVGKREDVTDEAIEQFMNKFEKDKSYKGTEFFEWHHYLTGSCLMGREGFVKNHGLDLEKEYTVKEFIELTENDYGSKVIKELKERWNEINE